jgi:hydrogenase maturation protein HypF
MNSFEMCPTCKQEYNEPTDRRYYSQTNSCSDCGVSLLFYSNEKELPGNSCKSIIQKAIEGLQQGKILAVKGIGGYLLVADAANKESILRLRQNKRRPSKPFALMYPSVAMLKADVLLSPEEEESLTSPSSPIILLQPKENPRTGICLPLIAPGLSQLGVMLPYAPLYELILNAYNKPVIATSANISNSPILYDDKGSIQMLYKMADYIISNNREIVVPQDDTVIKYSMFEGQKIVIRRSRGLAPFFNNPGLPIPSENILAMGALLKSTFTITHQQNVYTSQYLGDLDNYDVQNNYQHCLNHFYRLLNSRPGIILTDKHPGYFSTGYGLELSKELKVPVKQYQHHEAHFAAVLGENNLLETDQPVLGVIWDGTGLGNDGNIWGGEFFIYMDSQFKRYNHFSYFDYLLGDKMAREPRLSALATTRGLEGTATLLEKKFSDTEWSNYQKILQKKGSVKTSSAGRLFDAVASLLDLSDITSYEGEAAMYLENSALYHFKKNGFTMPETYPIKENNTGEISLHDMLTELINDKIAGKNKEFIAAKFHYSLATLVVKMAAKLGIQNIALGGGVFQNALLTDLLKKQLSAGQNLFLHRQLAPNDECISFGQLCCYIIEEQKLKKTSFKNSAYVLSHSR